MHWVFRQSCPVSCTFRTSQNTICTKFCSIGISVNLVATKSRCKVDGSIHKLVNSFGLNVTGLVVPFWTKNWRLVGISDFCDKPTILMVYIPESWNPRKVYGWVSQLDSKTPIHTDGHDHPMWGPSSYYKFFSHIPASLVSQTVVKWMPDKWMPDRP